MSGVIPWWRIIGALEDAGGAAPVHAVRKASGLDRKTWNTALGTATKRDARLFEWRAPGGRRWLGLIDEDETRAR